MRKIHLSLLFSLAILTASSQKVYFVYIQTESEQPFFVRMNEKVVSSSSSGYIILSKLVDSTYNFSIGFPLNKWAEQNFSVTVSRQDHGYLLKNFDGKGWGLFDLQTLGVQMAMAGSENKTNADNKDVSAFTDILSKAADDPSLKEKPVQPKVEEKKPEVVTPEVVKKEEPKVEPPVVTKPVEITIQPEEKKEEPKAEIKEQPITKTEEIKPVATEPYKMSVVKKWSESSTTEGFGLVFIDEYENGQKDTVRIIIPNTKPIVNVVKEEPKEEKRFLEIPDIPKKEEQPVVMEKKTEKVKPVITESPAEKMVVKNDCGEVALESDFFKLRKKMAAEGKEEDMILEAKKYFKTKCFTTDQLKNLSTLFLTDEGKYNFFDMAYKYVADAEVFGSLQAELKDEYYSSRFKAMLRN
ncbi:MAG: hypothetical protein SGI96_21590 [Bacteroidota bacterium]|nr:hypothetical protein [Bacteroidota bacterium]